ERRPSILVSLGKEHLAVPHDGVHMVHLARDVALQHEERLPIAKGLQPGPELFWGADALDADGRDLRARLEHPRRWGPLDEGTDGVVVEGVDEVWHREVAFARPDAHRQLVAHQPRGA